jgi:four helix bundle protein
MEEKRKAYNTQLEDRLIDFASRIIDLSEALPKSPAGKYIGGQLLRSGTSPALNYGEAQAAESKEDFLHKMKICLKELRETMVCLKLIAKKNWSIPESNGSLLIENNELIAMFVSSTKKVNDAIKAQKASKQSTS